VVVVRDDVDTDVLPHLYTENRLEEDIQENVETPISLNYNL